MPEKAEPKISIVEMVTIGLFLAILDVIDLIPFAGDLTDLFAAPLVFYYFVKNINGVAYITALILDLIPFIQELPTRSLVWWGTVAFDHFAPKKLEQAVEKVGEAAEGKAGGAGAAGELEAGAKTAEEGARTAEAGAGAAASSGGAAAEAGTAGRAAEGGGVAAGGVNAEEEAAFRSPVEDVNEYMEPQNVQFAKTPGARGPVAEEEDEEELEEAA